MDFKNTTKQQQLEFLNPLIEYASQMLLAGTLKKNVVRHFELRGFSNEASVNMMQLAEARAEKFSKNKLN